MTENKRPLCKQCNELADVLVMKNKNVRGSVYAYCSSHEPDPTEYGNKTTWNDKITLRNYNQAPPSYALYGHKGGTDHMGKQIVHVEAPTEAETCCGEPVPSDATYSLLHGMPDESRLCRRCLTSHQWTANVREDIVGRFLYQLRQLAKDTEQVRTHAVNTLDWPEHTGPENHATVEGNE